MLPNVNISWKLTLHNEHYEKQTLHNEHYEKLTLHNEHYEYLFLSMNIMKKTKYSKFVHNEELDFQL